MTPLMWLESYLNLLGSLVWIVVSVVGLVVAVRRRRSYPSVVRLAILAFSVLLFRGLCFLGYAVLWKLVSHGVEWAVPAAERLWIPYLSPVTYTLGFALLTAAVFTSRRADPE